MPSCWSCQQEAGEAPFCQSCGRIQPGRPRDYFALFAVAPRFHVEELALEKMYRDLSRKLHPDKFAKAEARERRFSLEQTTMLNQAWKVLKDPVARAAYLLQSNGFPVPSDEAGKPGAGQRLPLEFYEEVMEDREALMEAKLADQSAVDALAAKITGKRDHSLQQIDSAFTAWETSGDRTKLEPAATELAKLRYYARFLDEVEGKSHD